MSADKLCLASLKTIFFSELAYVDNNFFYRDNIYLVMQAIFLYMDNNFLCGQYFLRYTI